MSDRSEYIECFKHFVEVLLVRNMTDDIIKALKNGGYDDIEKLGLMETVDVGQVRRPL